MFAAEVCIILESASTGSLRQACHCQDCMLVTWVMRWIWCRCRGMEPGQFQQILFDASNCSNRCTMTRRQSGATAKCQTTLCTHCGRPSIIHSSIEFSVGFILGFSGFSGFSPGDPHPSAQSTQSTQEHMPMSTCLEFSRSRWKWSQSLG